MASNKRVLFLEHDHTSPPDQVAERFAEHGYHQASVNRIVGRLGIAKGSLFQYFGSKEGLFRHLFARALEELKAPR